MNIGIVCYASVGGSGIVATELAKCLAARGHDVHMISTDTPFRYSRVPARPVVSPRQHAGVSAVPRAAVRALARDQHRARGARVRARHHSRALRRAACDGGVPGAADSRDHRARRPRAEGRHDASRHRHHPGRQRSFVCRDGRLLDRAVRRRDGGLREPARGHLSRARRQAAHRGHPELPRLPALPPGRRARRSAQRYCPRRVREES